jgi:hypothetical protein
MVSGPYKWGMRKLAYIVLGFVLLAGLFAFAAAVGAPVWLQLTALVLGGLVWFRYRIREEHGEAMDRARAEALRKRHEREARKRKRGS